MYIPCQISEYIYMHFFSNILMNEKAYVKQFNFEDESCGFTRKEKILQSHYPV